MIIYEDYHSPDGLEDDAIIIIFGILCSDMKFDDPLVPFIVKFCHSHSHVLPCGLASADILPSLKIRLTAPVQLESPNRELFTSPIFKRGCCCAGFRRNSFDSCNLTYSGPQTLQTNTRIDSGEYAWGGHV